LPFLPGHFPDYKPPSSAIFSATKVNPMNVTTPSSRVRVRRLPKRGHYDRATLHGVLDAGFICHVGYVIDGQPYVTPTAYWREGDVVYWHGSSASRMLRAQAAGIPVCVTVTHLDGLVVARSGFHHSINYRSAMLFGNAEKVEDKAEKEAAMAAFVDRIYPGRWQTLRPVNNQEMKATTILRMAIDEASAKIRTGPPVDDEEDYGLPIWAGVINLHSVVGNIESDPRLMAGVPVPADIEPYESGGRLDDILSRAASK
jgi:nitroimidazol reductase NimA-like FMN-containing flavoprotein (pyridoxamine 5'-phosphate oxidase superfamily)